MKNNEASIAINIRRIKEFSRLTDLKLFMHIIKMSIDNKVCITGQQAKEIATEMNTSIEIVRGALTRLVKNGIISRTSNSNYVVNKLYGYKTTEE